MFTDARVADFRSPLWEEWRSIERDGKDIVRYCGGCGFAHRKNNHAPKREEVIAREDSRKTAVRSL
jgi:hypothetical protein